MAQTYTNWELLIQDDCSTDETAKVVLLFAELDSRIKYECNSQNSGAAITRNNALRRAKGRWLLSWIVMTCGNTENWKTVMNIMVQNNYAFTYHEYIEITEGRT